MWSSVGDMSKVGPWRRWPSLVFSQGTPGILVMRQVNQDPDGIDEDNALVDEVALEIVLREVEFRVTFRGTTAAMLRGWTRGMFLRGLITFRPLRPERDCQIGSESNIHTSIAKIQGNGRQREFEDQIYSIPKYYSSLKPRPCYLYTLHRKSRIMTKRPWYSELHPVQ